MKWSPTQTDNGWWPRLSPDGQRVTYGTRGSAFVADWRRGIETPILVPDRRVYVIGWRNGEPMTATVPLLDPPEPVTIDGQPYPAVTRLDAHGGSWCAGRSDGWRLWFNGLEMLTPHGWDCRCDGVYLTVQTHQGIRLLAPFPADALCGEVRAHSLRGPWVGYVSEGWSFARNFASGMRLNVTVAPGAESTPVIIDGWVWNQALVGGTLYLQGHPLGESRVIVRERPPGCQDWTDVVHVGGEWIVATCHDGGVMVVESIPDDEPLRAWSEIPPPTESPLPVQITPLRPIELGIYKVAGRYRDAAHPDGDYVTEAMTGAYTLAMIYPNASDFDVEGGQDALALGARAFREMAELGRHFATDASEQSVRCAAPFWNACAFLTVSAEAQGVTGWPDNVAFCEKQAAAAIETVATLNLPCRIIAAYFDGDISDGPGWRTPEGCEAVILNGYIGPTSPATIAEAQAQLRDRLRRQLALVPADTNIYLAAQAYDRSGAWTNETTLAALQLVYAEFVRINPRIRGLLWFAYSRPGGVVTHTALRPWHEAYYRATGDLMPAIIVPVTTPTPTPIPIPQPPVVVVPPPPPVTPQEPSMPTVSDKITSPSKKYELDIQDDGQIVVYGSASGRVIWTSGVPDPHPELEPKPPEPVPAPL